MCKFKYFVPEGQKSVPKQAFNFLKKHAVGDFMFCEDAVWTGRYLGKNPVPGHQPLTEMYDAQFGKVRFVSAKRSRDMWTARVRCTWSRSKTCKVNWVQLGTWTARAESDVLFCGSIAT